MRTMHIYSTVQIFSVILFFAGGLFSCTTNTDTEVLEPQDESEQFLLRPRFEKTLSRPLNHILLFWESVPDAESYEVQSSATQNFSQIIKTWSVITSKVEVSHNQDEENLIIWYRVRALGKDTISRWSDAIQIGGVI